jgi:hypothetical protein
MLLRHALVALALLAGSTDAFVLLGASGASSRARRTVHPVIAQGEASKVSYVSYEKKFQR